MDDERCDLERILADLRARLAAHHGAFPALARGAGLSYSWICKLHEGHVRDPRIQTLIRLQRTLDRCDARAELDRQAALENLAAQAAARIGAME